MSKRTERQQKREATGAKVPDHIKDLVDRDVAKAAAKKGNGNGDGNSHAKPHSGRRHDS